MYVQVAATPCVVSYCLREESQVKAIWDEMATSQLEGDERSAFYTYPCAYVLHV